MAVSVWSADSLHRTGIIRGGGGGGEDFAQSHLVSGRYVCLRQGRPSSTDPRFGIWQIESWVISDRNLQLGLRRANPTCGFRWGQAVGSGPQAELHVCKLNASDLRPAATRTLG